MDEGQLFSDWPKSKWTSLRGEQIWKVIEGSFRWDVWRCVNRIIEIPSKILFCQQVKRYKFLSTNKYDFCYWKVTLGVSIVLLNNPLCAVETNLPFWQNVIVKCIALCLWGSAHLCIWITMLLHNFTHFEFPILSDYTCILRMFHLKP